VVDQYPSAGARRVEAKKIIKGTGKRVTLAKNAQKYDMYKTELVWIAPLQY
jgi:hypothetical protein